MAMLGEKFPGTQFVVTGVLGPHSNAHGPNEFLHIPFAKKLSACIATVLADHAHRRDELSGFRHDPDKAQKRPLFAFILATLASAPPGSFFTTPQIPTWYAG